MYYGQCSKDVMRPSAQGACPYRTDLIPTKYCWVIRKVIQLRPVHYLQLRQQKEMQNPTRIGALGIGGLHFG
ncbi:unnamed protein product [Echinostoma caproni]|uniref:Oxidoreductase n=1 Tax=Echinostoma caproni TaxID=27848 RepID=A0A183AYE6_9TREM|nr:unnamed protein product [Echinostoma caproni]